MQKAPAELYIKATSLIEPAVRDFFDSCLMPAGVKRLGLAVSGGADSVALFHLLLPLCKANGVTPVMIHLNHGLRRESVAEAQFVAELARSSRIAILTKTLDLQNRAPSGRSLEMAAREQRLLFYAECAGDHALDAIATGHHADDLCETLLLRLARGAGIAGLAGMRPLSIVRCCGANGVPITMLRPLLTISASALRQWLHGRALPWHDDLSNRDTAIPRNNIRHRILPFLRENMSGEIDAHLCHSAATLREDEAFLDECAAARVKAVEYNGSILIAALLREPVALQRRILRHWLFQHDLPEAAGLKTVSELLAQCATPEADRCVQLPSEALARIADGLLAIDPPSSLEILPEFELLPDETILWGGFDIRIMRTKGIRAISNGVAVYPAACSLDAAKLAGRTLVVRQRREGDRIRPTGLDGSKKLKDILIDAKVPRCERNTLPVIACGGEVLWIPGYRIARDYAVGSDTADSIQITVSKSL